MAKNAEFRRASRAFETIGIKRKRQVDRLEKVFKMIGKPARGKTCDAINGIIEEGKEIMEDFGGQPGA